MTAKLSERSRFQAAREVAEQLTRISHRLKATVRHG